MSYYDHKWRPWRVRGNGTTIASDAVWDMPKFWNTTATFECLDCGAIYASESVADPVSQDFAFECLCGANAGEKRRPRILLDVDVFEPDAAVLDSDLPRVWQTIDETPALTWLLFTRRPQQIAESWPRKLCKCGGVFSVYQPMSSYPALSRCDKCSGMGPFFADRRRVENVWLGVDIATQAEADELIPALLKCRELCGKLIVRVTVTEGIDLFAMCEHHPQDGPYHEGGFWHAADCPSYCDYACGGKEYDGKPIDWLILQGDVGRYARPCNVAHVRELIGQSREAGVPCWVERLGSRCEITGENYRRWPGGEDWGRYDEQADKWWATWRDKDGADPAEWPEDLRAREVPT